MTITEQIVTPEKDYRMRHAYLVYQYSGNQIFGAEAWFGSGRRSKDDLLWFSTNIKQVSDLVDQLNTGRE